MRPLSRCVQKRTVVDDVCYPARAPLSAAAAGPSRTRRCKSGVDAVWYSTVLATPFVATAGSSRALWFRLTTSGPQLLPQRLLQLPAFLAHVGARMYLMLRGMLLSHRRLLPLLALLARFCPLVADDICSTTVLALLYISAL